MGFITVDSTSSNSWASLGEIDNGSSAVVGGMFIKNCSLTNSIQIRLTGDDCWGTTEESTTYTVLPQSVRHINLDDERLGAIDPPFQRVLFEVKSLLNNLHADFKFRVAHI